MAEKENSKIKCFLCGREGKCVDGKKISEDLAGVNVCPANTGCQKDYKDEVQTTR